MSWWRRTPETAAPRRRSLQDAPANAVVLSLDAPVRQALHSLLAVALELPRDAQVVDHVPLNPWGDLDAFRRSAYEPLTTGRSAQEPTTSAGTRVVLDPRDAHLVGLVLRGLAESFSGGVPWSPLSEAERGSVTRLVTRL